MSGKKILLVEDDRNIAKLVKYNLEKAGFECTATITGEDALEILDRNPIDLIILDIMLPKMDGFETCREIKKDKRFSAVPVVILTARGQEIDRIVGFELGVDDYVIKPFSPRELVLRIKAILKRGKPREFAKDILSVGRLTVDIGRHKVTVDKKEIKLTMMEFNLLAVLMQRQGRAQPRERLLNDVWDIAAEVTTRTIDTHVKQIRQKLGKAGKLIETVRGIGYRFKEED